VYGVTPFAVIRDTTTCLSAGSRASKHGLYSASYEPRAVQTVT